MQPVRLLDGAYFTGHVSPIPGAVGCLFNADAGVEELGHLEMVGALVHQLTRNLKDNQIQDSAFAPYFVDHTTGVYPTFASGTPWTAATMQVKGDPMADLVEDLAAEAQTNNRNLRCVKAYTEKCENCCAAMVFRSSIYIC